VWSVVVVVMDPGTEFESGVFDGLEAASLTEVFLERFDEALAQSVLLWSITGVRLNSIRVSRRHFK